MNHRFPFVPRRLTDRNSNLQHPVLQCDPVKSLTVVNSVSEILLMAGAASIMIPGPGPDRSRSPKRAKRVATSAALGAVVDRSLASGH